MSSPMPMPSLSTVGAHQPHTFPTAWSGINPFSVQMVPIRRRLFNQKIFGHCARKTPHIAHTRKNLALCKWPISYFHEILYVNVDIATCNFFYLPMQSEFPQFVRRSIGKSRSQELNSNQTIRLCLFVTTIGCNDSKQIQPLPGLTE